MEKPFIAIVFTSERAPGSTRYDGFGKRLQKAGGFPNHDILTVALENLAYIVNEEGEARVIDTVSNVDIADADFVYLKSWEAMTEEAAALAQYLFYRGTAFVDTLPLGMGVSKLVTTFRLWGNGVRVPFSIFVRRADRLAAFLKTPYANELGEKFILKDIVGAKGKLNFLVTVDEALEIIEQNPDVHFICQRFVPNDGDYRVGIYMDEPGFIIKRVGNGTSHLNNTSAGGVAEYIPVAEAPKSLLTISKKASRAADLQISGVDVIKDKNSNRMFVLEVNQGSQIVTGAYTEENIAAFNANMEAAVKGRYVRGRKQPRRMIGRRSVAKLPELKVTEAIAKIDTGAYSSTLHAENIQTIVSKDGETVLKFDIVPSEQMKTLDGKVQTIEVKDFFIQKVRSSNGHLQERYSIKTKLTMEGRTFPAVITLSNRSEMGYPFLVGRRLLRSRFLVNVELNERNETGWNY